MIHTLEHTSSISLDPFLKPSHFFSKIYVGINIKKSTNNYGTPKMAVCTNNNGTE
jgi:hypothetical protein